MTTDKILLTTRSFPTIFIKTMWRNSCHDDDDHDDHHNNNNYYYSSNKKIHKVIVLKYCLMTVPGINEVHHP